MAFNFPASANVGDIYSSGSFSFQFDGVAWNYVNTTAVLAFNQANAAYTKANSAAQITFGTVVANGTNIIATSNNDTLTIIANANVSIVGNSSTKNVTFDLTDTTVVAATYGNTNIVPVFTVDSKGRLTSVTNTAINTTIATAAFTQANTANTTAIAAFNKANQQTNLAFSTVIANGTSLVAGSNSATLTIKTTSNIAITADSAGNNLTFDLTTTGVNAGKVGNAFVTPVITIDSRGRITSYSTTPIDTSGFDRANVANATANTTFSGAVFKTGNTMTGNLVMSSANIAFTTAVNSGIYWAGTGLSFLHSSAANTLIFGTSLAERMRIDSNGNINVVTGFYATGTVSDAKANVLSQTLTDGASIAWDASLGRIATVTLGGARTLANATNLRVGTYILHVIQNTSGNSTLTFSNQYKFTANIQPSLTSNANARDMFSFVSDGTNMYGAMIPDIRS
jgi:hypothetical protein